MARIFTKNLANYMGLGNGSLGALLSGKAAFSVHARIKVASTTAGANDNNVLTVIDQGATVGFTLCIDGTGGAPKFRISARSVSTDARQAKSGGTTLTLGAEYFVGGVVDIGGKSITVYVNGVSDGVGSALTFANATWTLGSPTLPDMVGGYNSPPVATIDLFDGVIGDVTLWSGTLAGSDFASLAAGTSPALVSPGTLLYYLPIGGSTNPEQPVVGTPVGTITGSIPPVSDVWAYAGEAIPNDVRASDPTVLRILPPAVTGTGAITFAVCALDAVALETFTGTGAETFTGPALAAAGLETFTGTGSNAFTGPAFASTALETFTGTAAVAFGGPALDSAALETFTSTGAVAFGGPALAGTGTAGSVDVTGTGAIAFGGPAFDAVGVDADPVTGTGAIAFSVPTFTGGDVTIAAGGGGGLARGRQRIVRRPARVVEQAVIEGDGVFTLRGPQMAGTGILSMRGRGAVRMQPVDVEAEARMIPSDEELAIALLFAA